MAAFLGIPAAFENREAAIYAATLALGLGRYADAVVAMRHAAMIVDQDLTQQEKNMLREAYHNMMEGIGKDRIALSVRRIEEEEGGGNAVLVRWIDDYIERLDAQILQAANEAKEILHDDLIARTDSNEDKVFYYNMIGDLFRYCAWLSDDNQRRMELGTEAMRAYETGRIYAWIFLEPGNLARLNLALNYATLYHDVMSSTHRAIEMLGGSIMFVVGNPALDVPTTALVLSMHAQVQRWTLEIRGRNVNNGGGDGVNGNGSVNNGGGNNRANDNGGVNNGAVNNGGVNNGAVNNGGGDGVNGNGGGNNRLNDNGVI